MGTSRARHKGVTSYYLILPDAISILLRVNYMSQRIISVFSFRMTQGHVLFQALER